MTPKDLKKNKSKEIEIIIQCDCKDHRFLTLWQDKEFLSECWNLTYSQHYVPLWTRIRKAFTLIFCPYRLGGWDDFLISDEEMKQMVKKITEYYGSKT